jgi:hypothetical protein
MRASLRVVAVGGPPAAGPGPRAARPPRPRAGAPRTAARRRADRIGGSACGRPPPCWPGCGRPIWGRPPRWPAGRDSGSGDCGFQPGRCPRRQQAPAPGSHRLALALAKSPEVPFNHTCNGAPQVHRGPSLHLDKHRDLRKGRTSCPGLAIGRTGQRYFAFGQELRRSNAGRQGFASSTLRGGRPWTSTMNRRATYLPGTLT